MSADYPNKKEKYHMLASIIYLVKDVNAKSTLSLNNQALLSKIKIKKDTFMATMPYTPYDLPEYRPVRKEDIKECLTNRNIELTKSKFNNIGKIEISKELLMEYQSAFINKLKKWADLMLKNNSDLIFHRDFTHNDNAQISWVPFEAKQLINPKGGLYFIIFDPDSNNSEIMTFSEFMELNATYIEINKSSKINYFVLTTPPNKIKFHEDKNEQRTI